MEDAIRLIITVLFIGLVVVAIVFFGVFFLAPLGKINSHLSSESTSGTEVINPPPLSGGGTGVPVPASGNQPTQAALPAGTSRTQSQTPSGSENTSGGTASQNTTGPSLSPSDYKFVSQSGPVSADGIPLGAIKLTVSSGGFSPAVVTAPTGSVTVLAVISGDDEIHVFKFDDPALSSISVGVAPYSIRMLTFVINKSGVYGFHDDAPGRAAAGVVGKLILN